MDREDLFISFVVGVVFGAMILTMLTHGVTTASWRRETVERNLAQYCPTDGKWAWEDECP